MFFGRSGRSEHYEKGIRFFDQGQYEHAIVAFKSSLSDGQGTELMQRLSRFYLAEAHSALASSQIGGSSTEAIANLQEALAINPGYADLHFQLGRAYLQSGDSRRAIPCFEKAMSINPRYARASLMRGIARYDLGEHEAALADAATAASWDSLFSPQLLDEARAVHTAGDLAAARRLLVRMGETDTDDALTHARTALDLYRRGMYADAVESYRLALAISPEYADLHNQLGVTLFALGRDTEAASEFDAAARINPRYGEAILNHGLVLRRLGRPFDAQAKFARVLELDPQHAAAREALEALTVAQAA
jgi:Tfp pilus assembly protein PilF